MRIIQNALDYGLKRQPHEVVFFTANAYIRRDGALVMGRGAARAVRDLYPEVPYKLGTQVKQCAFDTVPGRPFYGLAMMPHPVCNILGAFQVKYNWMDPADLSLIACSVEQLNVRARKHEGFRIHLNFPGIGNGQLHIDDVMQEICILPDNVYVYLISDAHPQGV